jgi:hypothetical protein
MELLKDSYMINYIANASDFKINVFNQINSKRYEVTKTIDDYKIYDDIDIDIFKAITQSFCDGTYEIRDLSHNLIITFSCGIVKINVDLQNIICAGEDLSILTLKMEIKELKKQLEKRNIYIDSMLRQMTKYVNICGYTVNRYKKHLVILDKFDNTDGKFPKYFPGWNNNKYAYHPYGYHAPHNKYYLHGGPGVLLPQYYGMNSTDKHDFPIKMITEINQSNLNIPCTIFTEKIDIEELLLVENNILTLIGVTIINFELLAKFQGSELNIINCSTDSSHEEIYECLESLDNIKVLTIISDSSDTFSRLNLKFTDLMKSLELFKTNEKMNTIHVAKSVKIEIIS